MNNCTCKNLACVVNLKRLHLLSFLVKDDFADAYTCDLSIAWTVSSYCLTPSWVGGLHVGCYSIV